MSQHKHRGGPANLPRTKQRNFTSQYGHNGIDKVVVLFSEPVANLQLTPEQAAGMIEGLQTGINMLRDHLKGKNG